MNQQMTRMGNGARVPRSAVTLLATLAALLAIALPGPAHSGPPQRIVSIHVCADQHLISLAEPEQILALSPLAHDPSASHFHEQARAFPITEANAETIYRLNPDLVLTGEFSNIATRSMLERLGIRVETLPYVVNMDGMRAEIEKVSALLGQEQRGEELITQIEERFARLTAHAGPPRTALYLQRGGFVDGQGTLIGQLIAAAGFRNPAAELGVTAVGRVDLEMIVAARPDILLTSDLVARPQDQGAALLYHPALDRVVPTERRITLAGTSLGCPGAPFLDAITAFSDGLEKIGGHRR